MSSSDDILTENNLPQGLSSAEAALQLQRDGPNEIHSGDTRHLGKILLEILREPMIFLLLAAGVIYLVAGDLHEAVMLQGFVVIIIGVTLAQQYKTERVLKSLHALSSPRALVIRDSRPQRIAGRDLVRDDVIMLSEGDRVPADGEVLIGHDLAVDESLLTGESIPVRKLLGTGCPVHVYAGTMVVQGSAIVRVRATGMLTELGKIGGFLHKLAQPPSPLQQETAGLIRRLAMIGVGLALLAALLFILLRGNVLDGLLVGITLAMSLLPQEFLVILTIFMALGARRIAEQHVLTRHLAAIEALGETTVLCVDKTGTLTQNQMEVAVLVVNGQRFYPSECQVEMPEAFHELLEYSILASEATPYDPMEQAFHRLGREFLANTEHLHDDWTLVREYELTPQMLAMSHLWHERDEVPYKVAAKGAPEAILDLCHLDAAEVEELLAEATRLASDGYRVLAVARALHRGTSLPNKQHDFDFTFIGMAALADPLRHEVNRAVAECHAAGIRVVMITGDYPVTAAAIGRQIGLGTDAVMTGAEIEQLGDDALRNRAKDVSIFARVSPGQKLRLVQALKAAGDVVAMTGDGVNDAPALKAAHIGIAMGLRGTDVAREAASLVLLNDDFSSIVHTVALGRRIFENLRKAMSYTIAVHVPIAGLSVLPLLMGWPLIFYPAHIVFMELVINPACSIVFEEEPIEQDIMRRRPRSRKEPLLTSRHFVLSLLQGGVAMVGVALLYWWLLATGRSDDAARAAAFVALVLSSIGLIIGNRKSGFSLRGNATFIWVVAGTLAGVLLVTCNSSLRMLFQFEPVQPIDWLRAGAVMLAGLGICELLKQLFMPATAARGDGSTG